LVLHSLTGPWWAVAAGVILPAGWLGVMPTTCFDRGLIWSILGLQMLATLFGWTLYGLWLIGVMAFG